MKKICLVMLTLTFVILQKADAQCIKDIQNLIDMPTPCFFIGMVDYDNPECFEASFESNYSYTWNIRSADDGALVASYSGVAFQHSFKKFGGYEFCLEIDKDGDKVPDIVDCVTYTTCQICTGDKIDIEYVSCPYGTGCNIRLTTKINATNAVGLKPNGKFWVTYLPTPQELAGGLEPYDIEYDEIDVEYNAQTDSLLVSQVLAIPYKRGCFVPRIVFELEDGYGAHGMDWTPCTEIELRSEEKFRCIACANEDGDCIASLTATKISNQEGTCNMFTFCSQLREEETDLDDKGQNAGFGVSPNPATNNLRVGLPNHECESRQILVFNNLGQSVMKFDAANAEGYFDVDVNGLYDGLYLVTVLEHGKVAFSNQVVISK